jgi:hypothetical protein
MSARQAFQLYCSQSAFKSAQTITSTTILIKEDKSTIQYYRRKRDADRLIEKEKENIITQANRIIELEENMLDISGIML